MGVVMRLALTWVGLGLLANTAVATLSEESINELEEELRQVGGPAGVFIDSAEDELFDILQDNGDNSAPVDEIPEPISLPERRYGDDSSEVIESIDEIESITPIKNIQEVKSIKPVKSIEEIKSITPIKSIQEVKSIKKVKSILPVPDDIDKKFIADHNLVPTDGDGPQYGDVSKVFSGPGPRQVWSGPIGSGKYEEEPNQDEENSLRTALEDVISTLNSLVEELGDQHLCKGEYEPEPEPSWNEKPTGKPSGSKESKLPFGKDDIKSIDEITSMQEVKSMLPVKKITEVKSITPIKSIQEVTGLYELTDEQADLLRRLNAKWSGKARRRHRRRRF